jgi:hypothetical protein
MPAVPINDKRQEWLRKHVPLPQSIKDTSRLRVIMDTKNEHFGQYYKIHVTVRSS